MGSRFLFLIVMLSTRFLFGQNAVVTGIVKVDSRTQELVSICISKISELSEDINDSLEVFSNSDGSFYFSEIKQGDYNIFASFLGFKREIKTITVNHSDSKIFVDFNLTNSLNYLNEVVITGTKTSKRRTNSPVIVNVINSQSLDDFQACTLS